MADYSETPQEQERKTIRDRTAGGDRIIRSDYNRVVHEPHGVSGGAVAAIVIAAVACAVLITLLIMNNQQQQRDADADRERAEQQAQSSPPPQPPQQQPAQQPPIVVVPGAQPASPPPAQPPSADKGISSASLEASVTGKLLEDQMLGTYPLDVKAENGVVTLNGDVPSQALKQRATTVAKSVTGVTGVINNIRVKSQY